MVIMEESRPSELPVSENSALLHPRLYSFDFIRALAIMGVVFVHRLHYTWEGWDTSTSTFGIIVRILAIVLFTFAILFFFVSMVVNTYSLLRHLQNSPKDQQSHYFRRDYLFGFALIILNYIHRILFVNGTISSAEGEIPEYSVGIITGWFQFHQSILFYPKMITEPGTLFLLGSLLIGITAILQFISKCKSLEEKFSSYRRFLLIGSALFIILSPFVKYLCVPFYTTLYDSQQYVLAFFIGHFALEFSFFPYFGIGLFGAFLGISLFEQNDFQLIRKRIRKNSFLWLIFGMIIIIISDRDTDLGSYIQNAGINYLLLFLCITFSLWGLRFFDFNSKGNSLKMTKSRKLWFMPFAKHSLTIYFFEPLLAAGLGSLIDLFFGSGWKNNPGWVVLFGIFLIGVWFGILHIWQIANYKGSLESLREWVLQSKKSK